MSSTEDESARLKSSIVQTTAHQDELNLWNSSVKSQETIQRRLDPGDLCSCAPLYISRTSFWRIALELAPKMTTQESYPSLRGHEVSKDELSW
jgi:hypothetical protein